MELSSRDIKRAIIVDKGTVIITIMLLLEEELKKKDLEVNQKKIELIIVIIKMSL